MFKKNGKLKIFTKIVCLGLTAYSFFLLLVGLLEADSLKKNEEMVVLYSYGSVNFSLFCTDDIYLYYNVTGCEISAICTDCSVTEYASTCWVTDYEGCDASLFNLDFRPAIIPVGPDYARPMLKNEAILDAFKETYSPQALSFVVYYDLVLVAVILASIGFVGDIFEVYQRTRYRAFMNLGSFLVLVEAVAESIAYRVSFGSSIIILLTLTSISMALGMFGCFDKRYAMVLIAIYLPDIAFMILMWVEFTFWNRLQGLDPEMFIVGALLAAETYLYISSLDNSVARIINGHKAWSNKCSNTKFILGLIISTKDVLILVISIMYFTIHLQSGQYDLVYPYAAAGVVLAAIRAYIFLKKVPVLEYSTEDEGNNKGDEETLAVAVKPDEN